MSDDELFKWVEDQFIKAGYPRELCKDGNEWFISANRVGPKFYFNIRWFKATGSREQEIDYLIGVEGSIFQAETHENVIKFVQSALGDGCRIIRQHSGKFSYKETLEVNQNGNWEQIAYSWWPCLPFLHKKSTKITEYKAVQSKN